VRDEGLVTKRSFEDKATAHHEAAHAVAAVVLGVPGPIREVSIKGDERTEGKVTFMAPNARPQMAEQAKKWIVQQLVGHQAEKKFRGGRDYDPISAHNDYVRAKDFAIDFNLANEGNFPGEPWDSPVWGKYETKAKQFVDAHWLAIQGVADQLLIEETLDADRVRQLIDAVPA
jgi:ATP-dependent Zn protease